MEAKSKRFHSQNYEDKHANTLPDVLQSVLNWASETVGVSPHMDDTVAAAPVESPKRSSALSLFGQWLSETGGSPTHTQPQVTSSTMMGNPLRALLPSGRTVSVNDASPSPFRTGLRPRGSGPGASHHPTCADTDADVLAAREDYEVQLALAMSLSEIDSQKMSFDT